MAGNLRSSVIEEDLLGAANGMLEHPTSYDFPNRFYPTLGAELLCLKIQKIIASDRKTLRHPLHEIVVMLMC
jgi:hypothetical protein